MARSLVWMKPGGAELAEVELLEDRLTARGIAIGSDPLPYRLEYELLTVADYVTSRLQVRVAGHDATHGPWSRSLKLVRDLDGHWTVETHHEGHAPLPPPGGNADEFQGAVDCDLGLSPLTNTMPVLRSRMLEGGGPLEHLMAWVSVPDLTVHASPQTYTFVRREGANAIVNYASPGFTQDIVFDGDGLVLDYPSIGRRIV
ncbi:putative glycolipid-binding domain-containing protein [Pendulispora brunnea]|uniref:Glycolipid-binding domain-containing protein n=1 Tax=Pendulispora brunnea TaxID=2905690 RepID=A0ABZ2KES4_9BACT